MHNVLSNITPGNSTLPYIPPRHGNRSQHNIFTNNNGSRSSGSGGFTLLQGHIKLMAMVPNLPENELSPRPSHDMGRMERREVSQADGTPQLEGSCPPITPRLMPSASRFKRMRRASHNQYPASWHHSNPRTVSEMSLPPIPAKPVAMPSFGRHLPGTKRMSAESGIFQQYSNGSPSLPPAMMTPQAQQIYLNQYSTAAPTSNMIGNSGKFSTCPNMSYQMMNLAPPQQQGHHQQQQYEYDIMGSQHNNGSGDHHQMSQMLFHFQEQAQPHQQQQQFQYHQPIQPSYDMPYSTYPTKEMQYGHSQMLPEFPYGYPHPSASYSHHPQLASPSPRDPSHQPPPPCAVQSLPCFGTSASDFVHSPMYSASMPHINFNGSPLSSATSMISQEQCQELPPLSKTKSTTTLSAAAGVKACKSRSKVKQEVSILVEDSSVTSDDDSINLGDANKSSKKHTINVTLPMINTPVDEEEIQHRNHQPHHNQPKKPLTNLKYSSPGPDSIPTMRNPPTSRVLHTAAIVNAAECKDNEFCSNCKRCLGKSRLSTEDSQPQPVKKVTKKPTKKSKGLITSGRRPKHPVVAVHECFPSDSSITEEEYSDLDTPRKSIATASNNNNSQAPPRKRKPRMDAILQKTKFGDSSKVFDILHDLNPEEVRLFTCDYLVELLSSSDWSNNHLGLETMVRLARHRPKILLNFLGPILWYAFKHLTSPKSALCRAAIVTFTELFEKIGSALDNDLEKLTEKLVVKSLAPNMFIREECDKALESMVSNCSLVKVLGAIENVSKKVNVRAACHRVARMTKTFIKVAGVDTCLKPMYAEKILPMLFAYMTEANIQTRTAAKEALAMLMNHLQFEAAVTKHVKFDRNCTEVFKKLDKMRGRSKNRAYLWDTKKWKE